MTAIIANSLTWVILIACAVWAVKFIAREAIDPIAEKLANFFHKK